MKEKLLAVIRDAFSLQWDTAAPEEIRATILSGSKVQGTNMCILMLAILVASIGLNMNSTAIIIGAMLISPLMGGIMAIGYGIATNDLKLARNAFLGLLFQVVVCIVTSSIYFSLSPISASTSELLARTRPTIWDVLIALFGGLAGIIGQTRREKSNVIPGVAIATALMPPLCTAGYGIATGQASFFFGAMYLFFINGFFICISTLFVIRLMRLPCKEMISDKARRRLHINIAIIAVIAVIPSIILGYEIVSTSILTNSATKYLANEFRFQGTQIVQKTIDPEGKIIEVALIGKALDEAEIESLQNRLASYGLSDMELIVTQTTIEAGVSLEEIEYLLQERISQAEDVKPDVSSVVLSAENEELRQQLEAYQSRDLDVTEISRELHALYPQITRCSAGIQDLYHLERGSLTPTTVVTIYLPAHLADAEYQTAVEWLKVKLDTQHLVLVEILDMPAIPAEPEAPEAPTGGLTDAAEEN